MTIPFSQSSDLDAPYADAPLESSSSAVSWGSIFAGALAAASISMILILVGSGLGLTMISPWSYKSASLTTVSAAAAAWLVVVQWLSAALGGYLTGRLRTKWVGVHTFEVMFRDTAHGFLAWALATVFVAWLLGSALSSVIGAGAQATATAAGAAGGAATAAGSTIAENSGGLSPAYFTDALLRPTNTHAAPANQSNEAATAEVSRILLSGGVQGEISADDQAYLQQLVASRTGLSDADAKARIDQVMRRMADAKAEAQKAADTARKAASTAALLGALSLFVGAFIASVTATLGGRQRDEDEEAIARQ
jgi:hypothetical protein